MDGSQVCPVWTDAAGWRGWEGKAKCGPTPVHGCLWRIRQEGKATGISFDMGPGQPTLPIRCASLCPSEPSKLGAQDMTCLWKVSQMVAFRVLKAAITQAAGTNRPHVHLPQVSGCARAWPSWDSPGF